jgi:hypothetical protein
VCPQCSIDLCDKCVHKGFQTETHTKDHTLNRVEIPEKFEEPEPEPEEEER